MKVGQPILAAAAFQAAPRSATELDLVVVKPDFSHESKRPPERRLQPGLANATYFLVNRSWALSFQ